MKKWLSAPSNGAKAIFVLSILLGLIPWQIASQYIDQALVSRERELIAAQMTPLGQQVSNYFSDGVSILNGIQGFATLKEKNQTLATELNFQDFIQSMVVDERQIIQAALINDTQQYLFKDVVSPDGKYLKQLHQRKSNPSSSNLFTVEVSKVSSGENWFLLTKEMEINGQKNLAVVVISTDPVVKDLKAVEQKAHLSISLANDRGELLLGNPLPPSMEMVSTIVKIPTSDWKLSAVPTAAFSSSFQSIAYGLRLFGLLILFFCAWLIYISLRRMQSMSSEIVKQQADLVSELEERINSQDELSKSKAIVSEISKYTRVGIWECDVVTDEFYWSRDLYAIYGQDRSRFQPTIESVEGLIHPDDRATYNLHRLNSIHNKVSSNFEVRAIKPDHSILNLWITINPQLDEKGNLISVWGIAQDLTDRKTAEQELSQINRALKMLSSCDKLLARSEDEDKLLGDICKVIVEEGGYQLAWVGIAEDGEEKRVIPVASCGDKRGYLKRVKLKWDESPAGAGPTGTAIKTQQTSISGDMQRDPNISWKIEARMAAYNSSMAIPVSFGHASKGVLAVYTSRKGGFDEGEVHFLQQLAGNLSFGVATLRERKRHQLSVIALKESEDKFSKAFRISPDAIVINRVEDSCFVEVNEGFVQLTGYSMEEVKGKPISTLNIWDSAEDLKLLEDLLRTQVEISNYVIKLKTKEGISKTCMISSKLIEVSGEICALSITRDVTDYLYSEQALQASRDQLQLITDNMTDLISYTNRTHQIEYVSPSVLSTLGYQHDEIIGRYSKDFIHPNDLAGVSEKISEALRLKTSTVHLEYRYLHRAGHHLWMESTVNLLYDENQEYSGAVYSTRDISEKRKSIEALNESENKYRAVARNFPNGSVMLFDHDLRYTVADGTGLGRVGLSREALEGHTIFEIFTPETVAILEPYYRAVLKGRTEVFELPLGSLIMQIYALPIFSEDGRIAAGMVMTQDVTEHKMALKALSERARNLAILNDITRIALGKSDINQTMQAIVDLVAMMFNADSCYITAWNETDGLTIPLAAYGTMRESYPQLKVIKGPITLTESVIQVGHVLAIEDLLNSIYVSKSLAEKFPSKSMLALPLIGAGENLGAVLIGFNEIYQFKEEEISLAEQVAAEIALGLFNKKLLDEVRKVNVELEKRVSERTIDLEKKNKELETFTYSVSHDLKTPLRGIEGYSKLLMEDHAGQLDAEGLQFLRTIRNATTQMNRLIEDLLTYSRLERRSFANDQVDLDRMVDRLIRERQDDIRKKNIQIQQKIPMGMIVVDEKAIEQALRNLVDNAIKFCATSIQPIIEVGMVPEEDSILVWVKDNGIGFDMKYKDKIFEIFQRLHLPDNYPGTGIGLALVKKAMQRINGSCWAESEMGKSTIFYLRIPGGINGE